VKWSIAVPLVLAACSSAPKGKPEDATLARLGHSGDIAFNLEEPRQAAEQYRAALKRAFTRDDASAIADAGFNLATAELRVDEPREAMRTASDLRAELARRGLADPDFDLISATALFRLHDLAAADRVAASLTTATDPALANAAWFLCGLIADAQGDRGGLAKAVASFTPAADPADVAELRARLTGDPSLALHAADLRRDELDYRGMARALSVAARFTQNAPQAADLYLRAGRSAAAQGDAEDARAWLGQARDLATDASLRAEAVQALHDVPAH
jgi:tetratricopeptide (TPR) repeat protein